MWPHLKLGWCSQRDHTVGGEASSVICLSVTVQIILNPLFCVCVCLCVLNSLLHMSTDCTNKAVTLWGQVFKRCIIILTFKQQRQISCNQPESCCTRGLLGPFYDIYVKGVWFELRQFNAFPILPKKLFRSDSSQTDKHKHKICYQLTSDSGHGYCHSAAFIKHYSERPRRPSSKECVAWQERPGTLYNPLQLSLSCQTNRPSTPSAGQSWETGQTGAKAEGTTQSGDRRVIPATQDQNNVVSTLNNQTVRFTCILNFVWPWQWAHTSIK